MNETDLKNLKKEYHSLLKIKEENLKLAERKKQLEETIEVKEYLNLLKIFNDYEDYSFHKVEELSDNEILLKAISNAKITNVAKIYVYLRTKNILSYIVNYNSKDAYSSTYISLEDHCTVSKKINERKNFERNNIVIFAPKNKETYSFLQKIKEEYFKIAIEEGNASAKKYALEMSEKYKNKD